MKTTLDPRTKLFMVMVVSTIVMMSATTPLLWAVRILVTLVPICFLIVEKKYSSALRFLALYLIAMGLMFYFLSEESTGILKSLLTGYCGIVVQFSPAIITAWYFARTTKIGELMSAMQKMHVPDGITISLAVVMRFFPTIKEEYAAIQDAMKMRGITMAGGNIARIVEYRMIPLMFSCVNIGDELSAAAITRVLGGKVNRTSVVELKMGFFDYALMLLMTAALGIFIFFKYVK